MPNEVEIDIPDAWRYAVHPRRHGMTALAARASGDTSLVGLVASRAGRGVDLAAERERILAHQDTDPALAALARSDEPSVAADGVRLALAPSPRAKRSGTAPVGSLVRRGWQWGPTGRQALRGQLFRPFGAAGRVVLTIEPGTSAVVNPKEEPPQTIVELTFESSSHELGVFGDLPLVTRSELIRSLRVLDPGI